MIYRLSEVGPEIRGDDYWVAPTAAVIGRVVLGQDASVWWGAVVRGDVEPIVLGRGTNVQDCAVLHTDPGLPLTLGDWVTVGHHAMVHGCTVGDGSLIGIHAVVLNGARIGCNCIIGAGAVVPENMEVPDGSLVVGVPGKVKRTLDAEAQGTVRLSAEHYVENFKRFKRELVVEPDFD